jgi:hypothetical protein
VVVRLRLTLWGFSTLGERASFRNDDAPPRATAARADVEVDAGSEMAAPYRWRPARPRAHLAARLGLWGAIGLGCVGGIAGLLRPTGGPEPAESGEATLDVESVPGPVAGAAETIVHRWLTATEDDQDALGALFVEPPVLADTDTATLTVDRVTAVSGRQAADGYWVVTVAAAVTEEMPPDGDAADEPSPLAADESAAADDVTQTTGAETTGAEATGAETDGAGEAGLGPSTWYVEVGIVGEPSGGLAAITTPAVVPPPAPAPTSWLPSDGDPEEPAPDDLLAVAVEGFFDALLSGGGDPARYAVPGFDVAALDPPPFTAVDLQLMAIDELEEGEVRVLATVLGTTPGGSRQTFSYEVVAVESVDRWEIVEFAGAPERVLPASGG